MLTSTLYQPGLNCRSCANVLIELKKSPACFSNRCDVQDIMQSEEYYDLMDLVVAYIHVESLQGMLGFDSMIERIVNDNKLNLITPKTLIELRSVYHKYMKFRADSDKRKS